MIIGVAREIKTQEYRVAVTPAGVRQLCADGHRVLVEEGAGQGSGFGDGDYRMAGGLVVARSPLFAEAELVVKVKEPLATEYDLLRPGQLLFTYLHLAPNRPLTEALLSRRVTAFAYETLEQAGTTPLLAPMSEVAGRMAPLVGSFYLQRPRGGTGVLPSGVPGAAPARAAIIGVGVVGQAAVRICHGIGYETVAFDRSVDRLREIDREYRGVVRTRVLEPDALEAELVHADLVVGALYATGGRTPMVIDRQLLGRMKQGAVIVDVAIDQGGCAETSRPTTHDDPVFTEGGVIHYCVANMPGAFPRTSTLALANATLPFVCELARLGPEAAVQSSPELASALNLRDGFIVHPAVAAAFRAGE
jgi:alanine dehydrogenase